MTNIMMVPLRLDALFLEADEKVLPQMLDFTQLPYYDKGNTQSPVNSDEPYISENITTKPFQEPDLQLEKGVYLHWAMPDALTRGVVQPDNAVVMPPVPNRWLITRNKKKGGNYQKNQQWVVESDRLYIPDDSKDYSAKNNILYADEKTPFRYMGNKIKLEKWQETGTGKYFDALTSIGYGDPLFSSFYPHCRSVFGYHDGSDNLTKDKLSNYQYEILGWYSNPDNDFCARLVSDLKKQKPDFTNQDFLDLLKEEANWTVDLGEDDPLPQLMVAYASITFDPADDDQLSDDSDINVTVGNSPLEALAAYCATKIAPDNKAEAESCLEAISLAKILQQNIVDTGYKFEEERHGAGFTATKTDYRWTVKVQNVNTTTANVTDDQFPLEAGILPDSLIELLDTLNQQQHEYDKNNSRIEDLRQQLFSAWYKYQTCKYHLDTGNNQYPDLNDTKDYLDGMIDQISNLIAQNRLLTLTSDDQNHSITAATGEGTGTTLAKQLAETINSVLSTINPLQEEGKYVTLLYQEPAARYWEPKNPAVVIAGTGIKPSVRHGQNSFSGDTKSNALSCQTFSISDDIINCFDAILSNLNDLKNEDNIAFTTWQTQPWNPFLLQWETDFFPFPEAKDGQSSGYQSDFITSNFALTPAAPTLNYTGDPANFISDSVYDGYRGYSILTPEAGTLLSLQMDKYLMQQLLDVYCDAQDPPVPYDERDLTYYQDHQSAIMQWYQNEDISQENNPYLSSIISAYNLLSSTDFGCLSQVLGGFNPALIMQKQTFQLNIADPMQTTFDFSFTNNVKDAIGGYNQTAPLPENMFNPLRSGGFKLHKLRIVDTFGRYQDIDPDKINNFIFSDPLTLSGLDTAAYLPPRLAQPARINVSLLSAESDTMPMNSHLATSPVCGWVLTNNLDHSIMIYDKAGSALGSLFLRVKQVQWQQAPESAAGLTTADQISNPHLQKMVNYIMNPDGNSDQTDFFNQFFTALETSVENIAPDNYAEHQSLALMVGRPLALVRTALQFELQGLSAVQVDWDSFTDNVRKVADDQTPTIHTAGFTGVNYPIRVGEYQRLGDGVVGYWQEEVDSYAAHTFYTVQDDNVTHACIQSNAADTTLKAAINSPAIYLSMLIDPRASIHVTTGVLPVKTITIPSKYYSPALNDLEVTFLTAPILSDKEKIRVPLNNESGYNWSWLSKSGNTWNTLNYGPATADDVLSGADATPVLPDDIRLYEGWLKITREEEN